jgi:hypothetical protein
MSVRKYFLCIFIIKNINYDCISKKQKKLTFHQRKVYELKEVKYNLQTVRCRIKFCINLVRMFFAHRQFFTIKKIGLK